MASKKKRPRARKQSRLGATRDHLAAGREVVRSRRRSLSQRELDVLGLAAIAAGTYLALVIYLGWDGGRVGSAIADGLRLLLGLGAYATPCFLVATGGIAIARPLLGAVRSPRGGAVALGAGILLALAAQTAGVAGSPERGDRLFERAFMEDHGGGAGELIYWAAVTLFQRPGAHVLAILLCAIGLILLTGATISSLFERASSATRKLRTAATAREGTEPGWAPPEPEDEEPTISVFSEEGTRDALTEPLEPFDESDDLEETVRAPEPAEEPETAAQAALTPMGKPRSGVTESEEREYVNPAPKVLRQGSADGAPDTRAQEATAEALVEALRDFKVQAQLVGVVTGPRVSRYELRLAPGTPVGKVAKLKNDLAYALASTEIRILAPIPGKQAVGVEIPNRRAHMVRLGDVYQGRPKGSSPLVAWLGKDIAGNAIWTDLTKLPHLLIAGTTGSGKSGCVNAILSSILMHVSPNEVRIVLVDPKRVELNHYESIPHLLTPLVTNPRVAANVLANLLAEMENRYALMQQARARNLIELNRARRRAGESPLPYVLCVIDELADLMMTSPAEVEDSVIRIAQKARAVGLHLVLATQRPSADVITGMIKANVPSRIAFAVSSQTDSRVILDQNGAESLLGQGDMLFSPLGSSRLQRIQGAFITEDEIEQITGHWAKQGTPEFDETLLVVPEKELDAGGTAEDSGFDGAILEEAMRLAVDMGTASTSMFQRRLRLGYSRAGRLLDTLEQLGAVGPHEGSKPRQVLIGAADIPRILGTDSDLEETAALTD